MSSSIQRAEWQFKIWKKANDVRGLIDGWDIKQYVLGTLLYPFISENFTHYIEARDDSVNYVELSDDIIDEEIRDDAIKTKGYFIEYLVKPTILKAGVSIQNIPRSVNTNENLNIDLSKSFQSNEEIRETVLKIDQLRKDIDDIIEVIDK